MIRSEGRELPQPHKPKLIHRLFHIIYLISYMTVPFGMILRLIGEEYYERALRWAYNIFSRFYDEFTLRLPGYSEICALMVELANPSDEDKILDVACGTGLISIPMVDKASDVIGLDISLPR